MTDPQALPPVTLKDVGGVLTLSVAALELTVQLPEMATPRYCLPLSAAADVNEYVVLVAPATSFQVPPLSVLTCHFTELAPDWPNVKVAVEPAQTVWLEGFEVIDAPLETLSAAGEETVAQPAELVATARNCLPLSASAVVNA